MAWKSSVIAAAVASSVAAAAPRSADACGCFAPPTVAVSEAVVQAGERIVFAHRDGKVIAHIQIQYQGQATDFAWLLPVPAVPELRLGVEELFLRVEDRTQPTFSLTRTAGNGCNGGGGGIAIGCGASAALSEFDAAPKSEPPRPSVAIKQASAGPYDYAVLDASSKQPMLDWLRDNSYFVPTGTEDGIDPYIREGAYFLALKLRAGESTGDLQPIILEYASERPMIPIILTAVAAKPDMGILVWVLGEHRAIPHNYQHVLINEAYLDWPNLAANYSEVVTRAIDESKEHHAFVTEFAGSTEGMQGVLDYAGRFGDRTVLEQITDPRAYVRYLQDTGFWSPSVGPIMLDALGVGPGGFDGVQAPDPQIGGDSIESQYWTRLAAYADNSTITLDGAALTAQIWERVVEPTREAAKLFTENRMMTRLYSTMSPEEMTEDPVFAFNPDLPEVSNLHSATLITHCEGPEDERVELVLEDQRAYRVATEAELNPSARVAPFAARIEILRQEGQPEIVVDNKALLAASDDMEDGGCIGAGRTRKEGLGAGLLLGLVIVLRLARRRLRS